MRTVSLGRDGPPVGRVGLGCMGMSIMYESATRDPETSVRVIRRALEMGATLIDTADVYGPCANEELVGRAVRGVREQAVLATKVGLVMADATTAPHRDGRPEHIREAIDGSLRRLGTDHIDLWQLHRSDPAVPIEETWSAMAAAVQAGKVQALGLCEVSVSEISSCAELHPVASVQSELSLWTRDPLATVLPHCRDNGITFIPFCPLGRGFLTGSIATAADLPISDARHELPRFVPEAILANQAIVAAVEAVAASVQATAAEIALAWVLAQGDNVVPIPGTTSLTHLEHNVAADRIELSANQLAALNAVPSPVGGRY